MNHAKILPSIMLASVLLSGCASTNASVNSPAVSKADYNAALIEANKSLKAAINANYLWRDSGKILKKAAKAAKEGNYEKATMLANKAKHQGDMAVKQSKEQTNAGPR